MASFIHRDRRPPITPIIHSLPFPPRKKSDTNTSRAFSKWPPVELSDKANPSNNSRHPTVDESYAPQTFLWLQIENIVFKVCMSSFKDYSTFFQSRSLHCDNAAGFKPENPLKLDNVTISEFREFMKVIWKPAPGATETLWRHEWITVLKLSTLWGFSVLRKKAIENLDYLFLNTFIPSYSEMLLVAHTYGVNKWMVIAVNKLAQADLPPRQDEFDTIGFDMGLKVLQVRERYIHCCGQECVARASGITGDSALAIASNGTRRTYDFTEDILEIFELK